MVLERGDGKFCRCPQWPRCLDERLCPCKKRPPPGRGGKPESSPRSKSRLTRSVPHSIPTLPRCLTKLATFPMAFQVRQGALRCGKKGRGPAVLASVRVCFAAHMVKLWPTSDPFCSIWQQILYQGTPCAHQANPAQQVRRKDRGGPFVTDVLPIPPFFPLSLRPAPVSSPHRGRHVNSSSVLECFHVAVLAVLSKTARPAHPPPLPPCRSPLSVYRQVPSTPVYFSPPCVFLPCPHATFPLRLPSSHPSQSQLSSSSAQLGSSTHTQSLSHTLSLALALAHQQHILTVGGTARQDRQALFIHSSRCMGVLCVPALYKMHTHTTTHAHTHTHIHYMCTYIRRKKYFIVLGLGAGLAARCRPGPRPRHRL